MNAVYVVFPEPGVVDVWEREIEPPDSGEVQCSATKSLISTGTETYCLRGVFDPETNWASWVTYPFQPGYSMVGRVTAVGEGVDALVEGDLVLTRARHQSVFNLPAGGVHKLPDGVSAEEATWGTLAVTTQNGVRRAQHALGERVGVIGLGILGQLVTQYLALFGTRQVVAMDVAEQRLELARAHGATHTLNMDVREAQDAIREVTDGNMLDVVYDITGHPVVLPAAVQLVRKLGKVILLGDCPTPSQQHLGPNVVSSSVAILGIHGSMMPDQPSPFNPWTEHEMTQLFFDYLLQERMSVSDLITRRYSPADAPAAYERLTQSRSEELGVILDWDRL